MARYAMRDLTRANSNHPAWQGLAESGFRVYTPLTWKITLRAGRKERRQTPVIHDLLFVDSPREELDRYVRHTPNLQYRFVRGGRQGDVMQVDDKEMDRFILATQSDPEPRYYSPAEITPAMIGKKVRIVGGTLDGMEGNLLSMKGMRKKRLIVELQGTLMAAVEVNPEYIEIIDNNNVATDKKSK